MLIASNTKTIGLGENSGIKGGSLLLKNVQNIAIRNMNILDAFDPFPDVQKNDGFNAQYDGVSIESSKNIWVDHCHFKDTVDLSHVHLAGGELTKWQTYDWAVREIVRLLRSRTTSLKTMTKRC